MYIDSINKKDEWVLRKIVDWHYSQLEGLSHSQARYLVVSLFSVAIGLLLWSAESSVFHLPFSVQVPRNFSLMWYPVVLGTVAWGLLGSLNNTRETWARIQQLLDLDDTQLSLYDVDPKPSLADHVTYTWPRHKPTYISVHLYSLYSQLFYDIAYLAPILLACLILHISYEDGQWPLFLDWLALALSFFTLVPATRFALRAVRTRILALIRKIWIGGRVHARYVQFKTYVSGSKGM